MMLPQVSSSLKLHIMMQPLMSSSPYILKLHIVIVVQSQVYYPYCPNVLILSVSISHISHPIFRPWYQGRRKHNFQNHWYADYPSLHYDVQVRIDQVNNCTALKAITTSDLFLAHKGLAFRANTNNKGNFHQLLLLREYDIPELKNFTQKKPFTSSDIQN
ncbi:hypothetical protein PR048_020735 [Dryococelus australis]|uniref:Uncharacterized protein n=1 Tax=Dryococelus australis TaxID=614101 RepID=A0ABQ9H740_9NEOP|nr:hypothetical protein PR048_020735 [Dryococelus australis]